MGNIIDVTLGNIMSIFVLILNILNIYVDSIHILMYNTCINQLEVVEWKLQKNM